MITLFEKFYEYHKELNPNFWEDSKMIERIRTKLLAIAKDYIEDSKLENIKDILLTGSMCNYNYNKYSDLDVHIVIDFKDIDENAELVKDMLDGRRFIWTSRHDLIIKGAEVELYVQDENEKHVSGGIYSLMNDKWVTKPSYNPPNVDDELVERKVIEYTDKIQRLIDMSEDELDSFNSEAYYEMGKKLKTKIMKYRKIGLNEKEGEFSVENLVFKELRNSGMINKLIKTITRLYDKIYAQ